MNWQDPHEHLSRISTLWTLVHRAHAGEPHAVTAAQRAMLDRYSGAVHRYLLAALRDREAADELFQEFCVRFLRGDFRNANPERGRFRDFLKTAVFHLIIDHHKRRRKDPKPLSSDAPEPTVEPESVADSDREFLNSWRDELVTCTWVALREFEQTTGQPHHTVLQFRTQHPNLPSEQMANELGTRLGKPFSIHAIRQALHRAREKFGELFLQEVARSLEEPTRERLEAELIDLEMIAYCRAALDGMYSK